MIRGNLRQIILLTGLTIWLVIGCAQQQQQQQSIDSILIDTQDDVTQARDDFEAVKHLNLEAVSPEDFQEASLALQEAEKALRTIEEIIRTGSTKQYKQIKQLQQTATQNAQKSQKASQRVLRKHYLAHVSPLLKDLEEGYEGITNDIDHPLGGFKPLLSEIAQRAKNTEGGREDLTLAEVIEDISTLIEANALLDSSIQSTLRLDVIFFNAGQYTLSQENLRILKDLSEQIAALGDQIKQQFPDKEATIHLKIVGYADEMDFRQSHLIQTLTKGIQQEIPTEKIARRQFLNERLSSFRARTAHDYLKQRLRSLGQQFNITEEIVGKGEAIPPEIPSTYSPSDPRRRICKIYGYIRQ